jgi:hypothetical protein
MKQAWRGDTRAIDHHANDFTTCFGKSAIDGLRRRWCGVVDSD